MNVKPLEDRIVVEPSEAETTTVSGLVIPDTAKEKPQQGKVLHVGPGRTTDDGKVVPLGVSVGDTVLYSKYGGTEVSLGGKDLLILSSRDVLAVIEK
jgi:chaperonin GroES